MVGAAVVFALAACSDGESDVKAGLSGDGAPVSFDTYLGRTPASRALVTDIDALRACGFGVYAFYTPRGGYSGATKPDFMYNQLVEYRASFASPYITSWTYFPVKFWPNDYSSGAVDDQDGDTGSNPAAGTGNDRLSFFAYAPYADPASMPTHGITALSGNDASGDPLVTFAMTNCGPDLADADDILWGVSPATGLPQMNLTKQHTDETVAFAFRHALAKLRVYVRAVADEVAPGTNALDAETRILVNSITVGGSVASTATLNLNNTTANTPRWQTPAGGTLTFASPDATNINPVIYARTPLYDRNGAAIDMSSLKGFLGSAAYWDTGDNFSHLPAGVSATPQGIFATDDYAYLFIPLATDGTPLTNLTFNVSYTVVTRDPALVRNTPAGFSIVTNDISRTLSLATPFQGGKEYAVQLLLGMTSVKFEATVSDWEGGAAQYIYLLQNEEQTP